MPYIAHIGIVLGENYTSYVKDQWELILQCDGLRYHRRVNMNDSSVDHNTDAQN